MLSLTECGWHPILVCMTFVIAWIFCGKSHGIHYSIEFDRVGVVANRGVNDLRRCSDVLR